MLIQLAIGTDDIVLLGFDLREDLLHGGLSLPVPVEPRHAAGKQLTGLLKLRFLCIHLAYPGLQPGAIFAPQIQIPARSQTKGTVGIPGAGGARSRVGYGKGPHQPFSGHFLTFSIGRKINLRAVGRQGCFGLGFGKGNTLTGNLHIGRIA